MAKKNTAAEEEIEDNETEGEEGSAPAGVGHNRKKPKPGGLAVDQLRGIIQRVEKLEEEKAGIAADIRDVWAEAKGNGFDVPAMKTIIKMRKMDAAEREEKETILDTYLHALGMLDEHTDGKEE